MAQLETAVQTAASRWGEPAANLGREDLSPRYPWAVGHRVFLLDHPDARHMIVAVDDASETITFDEPMDLEALNRLFARELVTLPDGLSSEQLADATRSFLRSPEGFVGSPDFLDRQEESLHRWIRGDYESGETLFRQYAQGPWLDRQDGEWHLRFYFFTKAGGIEAWELVGDAQGVQDAHVDEVEPPHTFFFPYV